MAQSKRMRLSFISGRSFGYCCKCNNYVNEKQYNARAYARGFSETFDFLLPGSFTFVFVLGGIEFVAQRKNTLTTVDGIELVYAQAVHLNDVSVLPTVKQVIATQFYAQCIAQPRFLHGHIASEHVARHVNVLIVTLALVREVHVYPPFVGKRECVSPLSRPRRFVHNFVAYGSLQCEPLLADSDTHVRRPASYGRCGSDVGRQHRNAVDVLVTNQGHGLIVCHLLAPIDNVVLASLVAYHGHQKLPGGIDLHII